jgi:hypothetical protein
VVQAFSAAAVAGFAIAQFFRERAAAAARRTAATSRGSTTAFLLRRQLLSWIGESDDPRSFDDWIARAKSGNALGRHLDSAEARAIDLANLAAECSARVATKLQMAFALFAAGTRRLNDYATTERPTGDGELDWIQLKTDAEKDLRACVEALETGPINLELLTADKELDAIRDAENPIKQLAEALAAMSARKV